MYLQDTAALELVYHFRDRVVLVSGHPQLPLAPTAPHEKPTKRTTQLHQDTALQIDALSYKSGGGAVCPGLGATPC